jgi:hypothetical protein
MEREDIFNTCKVSISMLGSFFLEVAKENGEDKAVEMYGKD